MLIRAEVFKNRIIIGDLVRRFPILQSSKNFNFFIKKFFTVRIKEAVNQNIRNFSQQRMNLHQLFFPCHINHPLSLAYPE